ncbi:hypothetical protein Q9L58_005256 [Maublancomyces gigas]|uniref:RING-type domain-containing protein n=1 Tax=Discina gigas TaxID=1032678 RepID=A0ABR3GIR1_9PEZI
MGFSFRRGFRCLFGRARRLSGKTRCSVCLGYFKLAALRTLPHCTHTYCRACLRRTFSRLIADPDCLVPPRCCGGEITLALAGDFLDGCEEGDEAGLRERYVDVLEARTTEPVFCSRGCVSGKSGRAVFVLPEDVKEELDLALCSACGKGTCTLCRAPAPHGEAEGMWDVVMLFAGAGMMFGWHFKWKNVQRFRIFIGQRLYTLGILGVLKGDFVELGGFLDFCFQALARPTCVLW